MSTWEERMSQRAKAREVPDSAQDGIPTMLTGELVPGMLDVPRDWCTICGLPDAPTAADNYSAIPPCPRCGSTWRWHGRLADRDGTADRPPATDQCPVCYEWRRYPGIQWHFGWAWWRTCAFACGHEHHKHEVWMAAVSVPGQSSTGDAS